MINIFYPYIRINQIEGKSSTVSNEIIALESELKNIDKQINEQKLEGEKYDNDLKLADKEISDLTRAVEIKEREILELKSKIAV